MIPPVVDHPHQRQTHLTESTFKAYGRRFFLFLLTSVSASFFLGQAMHFGTTRIFQLGKGTFMGGTQLQKTGNTFFKDLAVKNHIYYFFRGAGLRAFFAFFFRDGRGRRRDILVYIPPFPLTSVFSLLGFIIYFPAYWLCPARAFTLERHSPLLLLRRTTETLRTLEPDQRARKSEKSLEGTSSSCSLLGRPNFLPPLTKESGSYTPVPALSLLVRGCGSRQRIWRLFLLCFWR